MLNNFFLIKIEVVETVETQGRIGAAEGNIEQNGTIIIAKLKGNEPNTSDNANHHERSKIETKMDELEKKDNPLAHKYDELKTDIQAIFGDMDKDGTISQEITGILGPIAVTLQKMSRWKESELEEFVKALTLTSVATKYQRIAIDRIFINGIKKLNPQSPSSGM